MNKYKLALFDLDGTILNTVKDLRQSINYCLKKYNYPLKSEEEVASFMGNGIRRLCELAIPNGTDTKIIDEVFDEFNKYYAIHCNDYTTPYKGVIDVIDKLKENGIIVTVVSNKADYAVQPLLNNHFNGLFEYGVGLKDGIRKKPYPDSCNEIINKFKIDKKDAIYIGDTEVDIETARNANIDCVSVSWGFRTHKELEEAGATLIIDSVDELLGVIL